MQLNNSQLGAFIGCSVYDFVTAKKTRKTCICIILFSYKITNQSFIFTTSRDTPNSTTSQPTII